MKKLSLVDEKIKSRGADGKEKIDNIVSALRSANNLLNDILEKINSDEELSNIYYEDRTNEIDKIANCGGKFESFQYLCAEYYREVDHPFFNSYEYAVDAMSDVKSENITVDNGLGITETETIYDKHLYGNEGKTVEKVKTKLQIDDLLTYGEFDKIMEDQYNSIEEQLRNSGEDTEEFTYDSYIKDLTTGGEFYHSYKWEQNLSLTLDLIPVIGDFKGIVEAATGIEWITGRELSGLERGLSLISIVPFIGDGAAIGGALAKGSVKKAGQVFGRELVTNASFMAGGQVLSDAGINPLFGMLIYQGRIGYKNWDNIINALNKNEVADSVKTANKSNVIAFPKAKNKPWYDFFSDKWNFDFKNIFSKFKNTDNVDIVKQSSKVDNLVSLESSMKLKNQDVLIKNGFDNQQPYYMQMASGQGTQGPTMMDGTGSIISNVDCGTGRVAGSGVNVGSAFEGLRKVDNVVTEVDRIKQFNLNNCRESMKDGLKKFREVLLNDEDAVDISKICSTADLGDLNLKGEAGSGIWTYNPTIKDYTGVDPREFCKTTEEYTKYYRSLLSDEYIESLPDSFWNGKNKNLIKEDMAKLRADIERTQKEASKLRPLNQFGEPSFESKWNVDNCAEIWSSRDAILKGARYDDLVYRTENLRGGFAEPCGNCQVTFKGTYNIDY